MKFKSLRKWWRRIVNHNASTQENVDAGQAPEERPADISAAGNAPVPSGIAPRDPSSLQDAGNAYTLTIHGNDANIPRTGQHMFQNAKNLAITGGQFDIIENKNIYMGNERLIPNLERGPTCKASFTLLREKVAPSAFHNSAQRNDPPRCHPNTRVQILQDMFDWILQSDDRETWLLWLNGAAGAGKSAIMQTLAERCVKELIAIASFFFFRGDATRNSIGPLMATLAYQLLLSIPETEEKILRTIERNPLIFDQTLESQLHQLLINPILSLPPHLWRTFAIFIDGLDECEGEHNQAALIKLLGTIGRNNTNFPIIFLLGSRREPQIEAAFIENPVSQILRTIPLDKSDIEKTSNDIRQFLNDKFSEIRTGHRRRDRLPPDWPPASRVEEIIAKSSGQFIYASVVINYVSLPRYNPAHQLDIIHDISLRGLQSLNPFKHLDQLYQHIFSRVENLDKVLDILAYRMITGSEFANVLEPDPAILEDLLADLIPVLSHTPAGDGDIAIHFLHASLPDFLQDQLRSQQYFLDLNKYCTKLLSVFLERPLPDPLLPNYNSKNVAQQEFWKLHAIQRLLQNAKASDQLQSAVMHFNSRFHCIEIDQVDWNAFNRVQILQLLKNLNFEDQGQAYQHVLDIFAEGYAKFWPFHFDNIKDQVQNSPDLCARICQLRPELAQQPSLDPSDKGGKL